MAIGATTMIEVTRRLDKTSAAHPTVVVVAGLFEPSE
jgi:hypothetical protein